MTVATVPANEPRIDVGWVVSSTLKVLQRRAVDLLLISLPFVWLPSVLSAFLPEENRSLVLARGLLGLVFVGGASLLTFRELSGGARLTAWEAIGVGSRRFGTLWGVSLISVAGAALGLVFLIVPGIILIAGRMAATTVAVAENKKAYESLDRAWSLSKGSKWRLAGLLGIAATVILALVVVPLLVLLLASAALDDQLVDAIAAVGLGPVIEVLIAAVMTVGSAAAYTGLRIAKEGSAGDVAGTFD